MKTMRTARLLLSIFLLAAGARTPVHAAVADLDPTFAGFGEGGKVLTDVLEGGNAAYAAALQPDGKIVVAGSAAGALVVARYDDNGALDSTFGGGAGYTRTTAGTTSRAYAVALQADGKIVVAGVAMFYGTNDFVIARYTEDGVLDSSFGGGDGKVTTDFARDDDQARGVVVQSTGKIVAVGFSRDEGDYDFALARYCPNGDLDTGTTCGAGGFGSGGMVTTGFSYDDRAYGVALQEDDKIVAAGQRIGNPGAEFILARYCPNGQLDNGSNCGPGGFDGDGKLSTLIGSFDGARAVAIQEDGKIVAAGSTREVPDSDPSFALARFCPNGSRDNGSNCGAGGFGVDGKVTSNVAGSDGAEAQAVAFRPDGTLIAAGYASAIGGNVLVTLSYSPNGAAGVPQTFDLGSGGDTAHAIVVQPDGRAVVAGRGGNGSQEDFALLRLWPDGTLDTGGRQTLGFEDPLFGPRSREQANALAIQPDGKIVLAGQIADAGASDTDFALARFLPDGRLDGEFGTNGRVTYGLGGDQFARAVGVQPDGKIVVAGYTSAGDAIHFMLARFNANGTPDGMFGFGGFYVTDFLGGTDDGLALAFAPDGKIVMGGTAFNGARNVFGVARFGADGFPDTTFDEDGKTLYEFSVGPTHWGAAVVVQPDNKIVLGGHVGADFALVRLSEAGLVDYGFGALGQTITDMGGADYLNALLLAPNGRFIAVGNRVSGSGSDFALAQYDGNGVLLPAGPGQPWANAFVDWGGDESALALDWRGDGQVVVAGCASGQFAWAQLDVSVELPEPIKQTTNFLGSDECAMGVRFTGGNKLVTAGYQTSGGETNFALARYETTPDATPQRLFLPLVSR